MQSSQTEDNNFDIPEGWILTPLCEAGKIVTGNTPPTSNTSYYNSNYLPWVTPPDLDYGIRISSTKKYLSREGANAARVLPKGSVMVSCIGNLGKVGIADVEVATNQQINSIIFNRDIDPEYGFYYCQTLNKWLESNSSSTTIAIVNKGRFEQAPFLKPDISIQKHIVKKLSSYLPQVQESCDNLTKAKQLLQRFRQSILSAAVTGKLTEEWREIAGLEDQWISQNLGSLFEMKNGKSLTVRNRKEGQVPVYGGNGLMGSHNKHNIEGDVIVVGRVGANCGNIHSFSGRGWITDNAISLSPKQKLNYIFFALFLRSLNLNKISGGTGQPYVSQDILSEIKVLSPAIEEQNEIVKRIKEMFEVADLVEKQIESAGNKADKLTQSILAKAFRGEI